MTRKDLTEVSQTHGEPIKEEKSSSTTLNSLRLHPRPLPNAFHPSTTMSHTPSSDPHFVHQPDLDILAHRPHKSALLLVQALTATAVFRVWPTLLFMGGWSTAVVLINKKTAAELTVPATMLTVLGVLLGLTLSYRTSSAYDRYWEGRRMWSSIILASRTWARLVWIHCPDTLTAEPFEEENEGSKALDECRAMLEKKTMVNMALAFAVAVKHYLRGEEGILYEDMYDLVKFIPSLNLPSGLPSASEANNASVPPAPRHVLRQSSGESSPTHDHDDKTLSSTSLSTSTHPPRPSLLPSRLPPKFRWSETFPIKYLVTKRRRLQAQGRTAQRKRMKETRIGGGVGHNVPLEISLFMSCWIADMQQRKTVDVSTISNLITACANMNDALASLERILTTPIPWSYNAHIWEVTYIYCLLLPFQLYGAGFNWITIPAVVITTYIVVGFAEIGSEIENPFGYDPNDLNLDHFATQIRQELEAITARPFPPPSSWVFTTANQIVEAHGSGLGADQLQHLGKEKIREVFKNEGKARLVRARSPEDV